MIKNLLLIMTFLLGSNSAFSNYSQAHLDYMDLIDRLVDAKGIIDIQVEQTNTQIVSNGRLKGRLLEEIKYEAQRRADLKKESIEYINKYSYMVERNYDDSNMLRQDLYGLTRSLAISVTLFDMTNYAYIKIFGHKKLRRILNEKDSSFQRHEKTFLNTVRVVTSFKFQKMFKRAINLYNKHYISNPDLYVDTKLSEASFVLENSYVFKKFMGLNFWRRVGNFFKTVGSKINISIKNQYDFISYLSSSIVYYGSKLFGNIVGSFQDRHGYLHNDKEFIESTKEFIRPLDILLEKTPFRLTDNFIPGYWGHAAIYIGKKDDLVKLGIWDHPLVKKYRRKIKLGRNIVEALRDNVQINSLKKFSDIDDFAVLRYRVEYSEEETREHILRALSHIGKKYDFNFDVETGETIVCSELHYRTYVDIDFQTTAYLGRSTISVDQVAEQGVTDMPFKPVLMYIAGQKVDADINQPMFDSTINKEGILYKSRINEINMILGKPSDSNFGQL